MAEKIYQALSGDEIRTLELWPGKTTDPIKASLHIVSLSSKPVYEALSYCWGKPPTPESPPGVECDHVPLKVTENLLAALHELRHPTNPRHLWIDAICINQGDNAEKGKQVAMMRDVYQLAQRVVIWLGKGDAHSDRAMVWALTAKPGYKNLLYPPPVISFIFLLAREYFSRVWIVQEVAMSRDTAVILCGSAKPLPWAEFVKACGILMELRLATYTGRAIEYPLMIEEVRQNMMDDSAIGEKLDNLLVTVSHYRRFNATNPRDKIYALKGLARHDSFMDKVPIDYDVDVEQLFINFAKAYLQETRNLDILSASRPDSHTAFTDSSLSLPSWVPDWTLRNADGGFLSPPDKTYGPVCFAPLNATGASTPYHILSPDSRRLGLRGVVVDQIKVIGDATKDAAAYARKPDVGQIKMDNKVTLDLIINLFQVYFQAEELAGVEPGIKATYGPTGEDLTDVFGQCMISGHIIDSAETDLPYFRRWFAEIETIRKLHKRGVFSRGALSYAVLISYTYLVFGIPTVAKSLVNSIRKSPKAEDPLLSWSPKLVGVNMARRFFSTNNGYMGSACRAAQAGDMVVLFQGAMVPIIIREKSNDWELVGDCYLHGVMDGSYWEAHRTHSKDFWLV